MDPVAIRSYLASLGQGGLAGAGGGGGAGGAQGMLANLRNQLYGQQALQGLGGGIGGPGAGQQALQEIAGPFGPGGVVGGPAPLDPNSPGAQFYRDALEGRNMSGAGGPGGAGQPGGSAPAGVDLMSPTAGQLPAIQRYLTDEAMARASAERNANAAGANQAGSIRGFTPNPGFGGAASPNAAPIGAGPGIQTMEASLDQPSAGMPFGVPPRLQELAARDPAAAQARYAAFQAGQLPGQQGGSLQSVTGGGLAAPTATAQPLPATLTAPVSNTGIEALQPGSPGAGTGPVSPPRGVPAGVSGVAGAVGSALRVAGKPGASVSPATAAGNVGQAVQQTKPMGTTLSSAPNAAVLGAEEFKGPNARRIVQARGGIYNNVRQALRRPAGGGNKAGGG